LTVLNQALSRALIVATTMPARYFTSNPKIRSRAATTTTPSTTS
jgi:hypothetical protein